ncbi:hypothetical protein F2Q69_00014663 [Brassica cretica]|uniref:Uncharacterized protein n=1 Tax=Brassica cretica TaxID=69181 RepID=A0A8S9R6K2_BRACR|nr:hypothetical protein F2Q69_00014663 [Brassica cretica]
MISLTQMGDMYQLMLTNGDFCLLPLEVMMKIRRERLQEKSKDGGKDENSDALIPLSEFSEAAVMKKYGVKPDAETLDIANTAARQKFVNHNNNMLALMFNVKEKYS